MHGRHGAECIHGWGCHNRNLTGMGLALVPGSKTWLEKHGGGRKHMRAKRAVEH